MISNQSVSSVTINKNIEYLRTMFPGIIACGTVALASQFLANNYGMPAMLMALLLGIAFHFLGEDGRCVPGIAFASRTLLRFSVALLGARISVNLLSDIGPAYIGLVIAGVISTILFGLVISHLLGRGWRLGLVTGGSVAICGASAAIAIAAVLPKNKSSERNLVFTIMSVTILSTIAMVIYPIIASYLELDPKASGVFLGGSIHDVAQVVGAGFSISEQVGDTSTVVKLSRVMMLAPVVLVLSISLRRFFVEGKDNGKKPPILPSFVVAFLILAAVNSFHLIPSFVVDTANATSKWGLLTAIAAVGMKTSMKDIREIGETAIILVCAETIFIGVFVLAGLYFLR